MPTSTRYTCATIDGDFLDIRETNNGGLIELIFCEDGSEQETALLDLHIDDAVKLGKYLCSLEKKSYTSGRTGTYTQNKDRWFKCNAIQ